ncbi:MAG: ABC transporter ATP-binding protein, partial [Bacteroidota bacterium]
VSMGQDRQADASIMSFMIEKLQNVILVKLSNQYQFEEKRLVTKIKEYIEVNLRMTLLMAKGNNLSFFLITLAPVIIIGFGSDGIFAGTLTLGTLIAFLEYFHLMFAPARGLVGVYYQTLRAKESMSRIMSFQTIEIPDIDKREIRIPEAIEQIEFKNVQLTLGENMVLKGVNLVFQRGRSYGFVGGSGSGKSTLTFLLCGLYKPTNGRIKINDQLAENLGIYALSEKIALVRSSTKLLQGTIRDNLLYGLKESSVHSLKSVIRLVELEDFIATLPNQLDTQVSDLGTKFSDGQRQRLSIARALLMDTEILILDEATSAMDSITESALIKNIRKIYQNGMLIVISHRLSSVQHLDEIICLKNGVIVEQDNHVNLISKQGFYWELFDEQLIKV